MSRYRTSVVAASLAMAVASCGILDFRPVGVTTVPSADDETLPDVRSVVSVSFSAEPVARDAERAFGVSSTEGEVEGEMSWDGPTLSFAPSDGWKPGSRYCLELEGEVDMADGRQAEFHIDVPFFAVVAGRLPFLASYRPPSGSSIGAARAGGEVLRLVFSAPMDRLATQGAVSLRPSAGIEYDWSDDGTTLAVRTGSGLKPCVSYSWSVSADALSARGAPMARTETGSFCTDADATPPSVLRAFPVRLDGTRWIEAAPDLSALGSGDSIGVEFSEAVDAGSVATAVRVERGVAGEAELVSPRLAVFRPDGPWSSGLELCLVVDASLEDEAGLAMAYPYRERFEPATHPFTVASVTVGGASADSPQDGLLLHASLGDDPDGALLVVLRFSLPLSTAARVAAFEATKLSAFFPSSLGTPALRSATWTSSDTVALIWEGLESGSDGAGYYYELLVPGAVGAGDGLELGSDTRVYVEAGS